MARQEKYSDRLYTLLRSFVSVVKQHAGELLEGPSREISLCGINHSLLFNYFTIGYTCDI